MGFPGQIAGFLLIGPSPFRAIPGIEIPGFAPSFPRSRQTGADFVVIGGRLCLAPLSVFRIRLLKKAI